MEQCNSLTSVRFELSVNFEGVHIVIKYTDWKQQPSRENYLSINIYDSNKKSMSYNCPAYAFIQVRFVNSTPFKQLVEQFKMTLPSNLLLLQKD